MFAIAFLDDLSWYVTINGAKTVRAYTVGWRFGILPRITIVDCAVIEAGVSEHDRNGTMKRFLCGCKSADMTEKTRPRTS